VGTVPTLIVTSGPASELSYEIESALVIGRGKVDVRIDDRKLSRKHASVSPAVDGVLVEDLGSTNGTWVNDARIDSPVTVGHGARIRVGETIFEVHAEVAGGRTVLDEQPESSATVIEPGREREPALAPESAAAPSVNEAPAAAEPVAAVKASAQPFGALAPAATLRRSRGSAATRLWVPMVLCYATVAATAVALVLYFASR
jgi:pSer/pThr/pTyr-binding forkhead associated (FHA) protein